MLKSRCSGHQPQSHKTVIGQSSLAEGNIIHVAIIYGLPAVCYVGAEISRMSQSNTGSAVMEGEAEYYLRLDIQILAHLLITYGNLSVPQFLHL